jgi:pimeloyl-ACP methyl ester carboxylesterase
MRSERPQSLTRRSGSTAGRCARWSGGAGSSFKVSYGSGVPGFREQLLGVTGNAIVRAKPDSTYADGDDASWMGVDWQSLSRTVEVAGRELNVIDSGGDGPPLLLIHGLGGVWQNWLLTIPALMDSFRVVAPDLPGFGGSEMPVGRISIQGYARVVDELCSALGIDCPIVVGNSMGGFIGAELALAFPTRVQKLVLVSAAGLSVASMKKEPLLTAGRLLSLGTTRAGTQASELIKRPRLRRAFLQFVVRYPEKLSVPLASELVRGGASPGLVGGLDAILTYKIRERLSEIEVPTLIVWGRNDILVPVSDAAEFERLIGDNAHAVIFEDTGHLPMIERPSRFNALLADFIAGSEPPEAGVPGVVSP